MRLATFFAIALFWACTPTQTATPRPEGIPLPQLSEEQRGDPLCGAGYKWDGTRCIHQEPTAGSATTAYPAQMQVVDVKDGTGKEASLGDLVSVDYTASLTDGTVVDASRPRGKPLQFRLGAGQVIKGFERGVVGMKTGGIRKLTIPSDLAYGKRGVPPTIPPDATLVFEVELQSIGSE
ncbi:MAG TPA: FKBP-type peptidyl-prolyl cis-trans isomerase [Polyangiaceae bacterium]|jgi:FKBP-type peptidyl-prolyl cis-trans isomerase